jgi:hypothetical protein
LNQLDGTFTVNEENSSDSDGSNDTITNEEGQEQSEQEDYETQIGIPQQLQNESDEEEQHKAGNSTRDQLRPCSVVLTRCPLPNNLNSVSDVESEDEGSKKKAKKVPRKRKSIHKWAETRPKRLARPKSGSMKEKSLQRKLRRS